MGKLLTPEEIEEFKRLKAWAIKCPIEAAMRIQSTEEDNACLRKALQDILTSRECFMGDVMERMHAMQKVAKDALQRSGYR